jgi:hypothetical protein
MKIAENFSKTAMVAVWVSMSVSVLLAIWIAVSTAV